MNLDTKADELPSPRRTLPEGLQLLRQLNHGAGNYQMRKATSLLGFVKDGYWLCRFAHDSALAGVLEPAKHPTSMNWDQVVEYLRTPQVLEDNDLEPGTMGPHLALLEIAASLAVGHPVDLCRAALVLPAREWREILERLESAADFL
ncbi:hypothetical protein ACIBI8_37165 [Streptomyces sp. NPDC050529]|uniref:hypothetical protein n=1 Tax=Streptomyces sp. NPDC050529 TaxID=3365624 RepID=UPI00378FE581